MKKYKILVYLMILVSMILCMPSIMYLINNKTVDQFDGYYTYSLIRTDNLIIRIMSGLLVIGVLLLFGYIYINICKHEKQIFNSRKQILMFILLISIIFMFILPFVSSDIYYYIGDSWLAAKYGKNPYYTSVGDLQNSGINDEILNNTGYWKNTTSVYGPIWNMTATLLVKMSFGKVTIALFIFKFAAYLVHILNSHLMYKITKSNKWMLIYGLNPLVLLELLSNVHNDIYLILFILLTIYTLTKKNNIWLASIFISISIAIKYSTILICPFILLYYFRNENNIPQKILKCIGIGLIIISIVVLLYMPYFKDVTIFKNMLVQSNRYSQSIWAYLATIETRSALLSVLNDIKLYLFALSYVMILIKCIFKTKINFSYLMRKYNWVMLVFIFLVLTNFQKWYVLWLMPTLIWERKNIRNFILNLTIFGMAPSLIYFIIENDTWVYGVYYSIILVILSAFNVIVPKIIENKKIIRSK